MSEKHNMEIRDHALIYALLVKEIYNAMAPKEAEETVRNLTVLYGHARGKRMRMKAEAAGEKTDLSAYLIHGEWKGKPHENESVMEYGKEAVYSFVKKCAWYETWKEYDLLPYGTHYCRYIDQALCEGFDGGFSLDIPSSLGRGDAECLFVWNQAADEQYVQAEKQDKGGTYILSFDFHVNELLACAKEVLKEKGLENLTETAMEEYKKLA